jgi:anti-anti-sigma factor
MGYDFDLKVEMPGGGTARVVVCGEIDIAVADVLTTAVAGTLRTDGVRLVEADFTGVRFLDACGVSALLRAHNAAEAHGKTLRIHGVNGLPLRVLEITGVLGLLDGKPRAPE